MAQQVAFEDGAEQILSAELPKDSLPNNWRVASLGEINKATSETINPLHFPEEVFEYYSIPAFQDQGLPVYEQGKQILSNKLLIQENTVLFGKLNPRVLKVWLVESTSKSRKIASTEFIPILANNKTDPKFVYYICQSSFIVETAKRLVSGSTPSRQRVDLMSFYQIPIPLPPLPEQHAIAYVLRTAQESIQTRRRELELERERKAALMQYLFTHGTRNEPLKQTEIGEMPQSWRVVHLGNLCEIVRGSSPRPKGDPRYYGGNIPRLMIADVTRDGAYVTPQIDFLTEAGAKLSRPMKKGDLVLSISGTVGLPCFLAVDACIHDGFIGLKEISEGVIPYYLYAQLLFWRERLNIIAPMGSIFKNLTTDIVKNFPIMIPSLDEQAETVNILSACDTKIDALKQEIAALEELFRAILEELMTGRISTLPLIETEQVG